MSRTANRIVQPAVIALGGNLGDREATLTAAVRELADTDGVELVAVSRFHETAAVRPDGVDPTAPAYLNAVALVRTTLAPLPLLDLLAAVEERHGRTRGERWADRTLDLDLIAFADLRRDDERLTLPHPRAHERGFVLRPWLEIQPDAVLPGRGPVAALLEVLDARTSSETER